MIRLTRVYLCRRPSSILLNYTTVQLFESMLNGETRVSFSSYSIDVQESIEVIEAKIEDYENSLSAIEIETEDFDDYDNEEHF